MALVDEYSFRKDRDPCPFAGKTARAKGCNRFTRIQNISRGVDNTEVFEDCLENNDFLNTSTSTGEVDANPIEKRAKVIGDSLESVDSFTFLCKTFC